MREKSARKVEKEEEKGGVKEWVEKEERYTPNANLLPLKFR